MNLCPECGTALLQAAVTCCGNPDCPAIVRQRITHWCAADAMDIAISKDFISQLVARGLLLDVADIYRLRWNEVLQFDGMNDASTETLLASIDGSKSREWIHVLFGLGIPGINTRAARMLAQRFKSVEELAAASRSQLLGTDSVTEETASEIARWFADSQNRKLLKRLRQAGLNLG